MTAESMGAGTCKFIQLRAAMQALSASRPLCPPHTGIGIYEPCMAFAVNHLSTSDRSQPPEMCFGGKSPFLHHRKRVERLTPTTRTTSLVLMRVSIPERRPPMGNRFGFVRGELGGVCTGGTMSTSGSCTG